MQEICKLNGPKPLEESEAVIKSLAKHRASVIDHIPAEIVIIYGWHEELEVMGKPTWMKMCANISFNTNPKEEEYDAKTMQRLQNYISLVAQHA